MTPVLRNSLFVAAALSTVGGIGLYSTSQAVAPLTAILLSVDGTTQTCPAQGMQFGAGVITITGLACAVDPVFRNGFEVQ